MPLIPWKLPQGSSLPHTERVNTDHGVQLLWGSRIEFLLFACFQSQVLPDRSPACLLWLSALVSLVIMTRLRALFTTILAYTAELRASSHWCCLPLGCGDKCAVKKQAQSSPISVLGRVLLNVYIMGNNIQNLACIPNDSISTGPRTRWLLLVASHN